MELRGDPDGGGHIEHAQINYKKLVFAENCIAPSVSVPLGLRTYCLDLGGPYIVAVHKLADFDILWKDILQV